MLQLERVIPLTLQCLPRIHELLTRTGMGLYSFQIQFAEVERLSFIYIQDQVDSAE
jgi:hypothetical protein